MISIVSRLMLSFLFERQGVIYSRGGFVKMKCFHCFAGLSSSNKGVLWRRYSTAFSCPLVVPNAMCQDKCFLSSRLLIRFMIYSSSFVPQTFTELLFQGRQQYGGCYSKRNKASSLPTRCTEGNKTGIYANGRLPFTSVKKVIVLWMKTRRLQVRGQFPAEQGKSAKGIKHGF